MIINVQFLSSTPYSLAPLFLIWSELLLSRSNGSFGVGLCPNVVVSSSSLTRLRVGLASCSASSPIGWSSLCVPDRLILGSRSANPRLGSNPIGRSVPIGYEPIYPWTRSAGRCRSADRRVVWWYCYKKVWCGIDYWCADLHLEMSESSDSWNS